MRTRVGESEKAAKWVRTAGEIRNAEKGAFNKNRDQTLIKIQPIRVRIWHKDSLITSLALTESD